MESLPAEGESTLLGSGSSGREIYSVSLREEEGLQAGGKLVKDSVRYISVPHCQEDGSPRSPSPCGSGCSGRSSRAWSCTSPDTLRQRTLLSGHWEWSILTVTSKRLLGVRDTVSVGPPSGRGILRWLRGYLSLSFLLLGFHFLGSDSVKFKVRVIRLRLNLRLRSGVVVFVDRLPLLGEHWRFTKNLLLARTDSKVRR